MWKEKKQYRKPVIVSAFIISRKVFKKLGLTYTTLWNSSQIKRHLGLMPVSLFRAGRCICRKRAVAGFGQALCNI